MVYVWNSENKVLTCLRWQAILILFIELIFVSHFNLGRVNEKSERKTAGKVSRSTTFLSSDCFESDVRVSFMFSFRFFMSLYYFCTFLRLSNIRYEVGISETTMQHVQKYWEQKRSARCGVPLIRRLMVPTKSFVITSKLILEAHSFLLLFHWGLGFSKYLELSHLTSCNFDTDCLFVNLFYSKITSLNG